MGLALTLFIWHICLYRPPEDHLGVIYRLGRLSRLVQPDEWAIILPGIHQTKDPVSLHVRRLEVPLSELLTQDQVPVDCELIAFYRLDLRLAAADFRSEALQIPEVGWNSVIKTALQEIANEAIGGLTSQQLLTPVGRKRLKRILSALLAERVGHFGLVVSRQTGVSVQVLRPAEAIWEAMVDQLTAVSLGEAALARIYPMLEELSQRHPEIGWEALLLEWASVMAKEGRAPQSLMAYSQGSDGAIMLGTGQRQPDGRAETAKTATGFNGKREANMARPRVAIGSTMRPDLWVG